MDPINFAEGEIIFAGSLPTYGQGWSASAGKRMAEAEMGYIERKARKASTSILPKTAERQALNRVKDVKQRGHGSTRVIDQQGGLSRWRETMTAREAAARDYANRL